MMTATYLNSGCCMEQPGCSSVVFVCFVFLSMLASAWIDHLCATQFTVSVLHCSSNAHGIQLWLQQK